MSLYNCKEIGDSYQITKFTNDLEVESSYLTSYDACDCPAGHRPICRHRTMLPLFIAKDAVRGQWFYNFDHKAWVRASTEEALEESAASEANEVIEPCQTPEEALEAMTKCDYWNGRKSLGEPEPINLLELAKPTHYEAQGAITGRFKGSGHIEEVEKSSKPLRRL